MTLGVVICTGTLPGLAMKPPCYLSVGGVMVLDIEGLSGPRLKVVYVPRDVL